MNNLENVRQLALESLDKYKGLPVKNISSLVESELTFWETSLFPIYDSLYLPRYQTLIDDFLVKAGFDVSVKKLTNTVFYVKEKRKKKAIKGGVSLPAAGGAVPGVVVQPIGSVAQSNPSLGSVPSVQPVKAHIVPVESSGLAPSMYGFNIPDYVVRESSLVAIEDFDMYPDELNRLKREKDDGFNVAWSGVDENIFKEFVPKLLESSKLEISDKNKLDFNSYLPTYLKKVFKGIDEVKLELYKHILMKLKVQKR